MTGKPQSHRPKLCRKGLHTYLPEKWACGAAKGCQECERLRNREHAKVWQKFARKANPAKYRNSVLKRLYGLSVHQYDAMLSAQNKSCAICERPQSEFKKPLCVDHRHSDKLVRGLLCAPCNNAIGLMREDRSCLGRAMAYLEPFE